MPRRPKYRGTVVVETKDCTNCEAPMFKQVSGMQWICIGCDNKEDV